ncbi:hypothetical protein ILFOPFJJ_05874 [Ensifer psoraleae]|nr:hypothetical protein [Sinorhizobium psoraleae]
MAWNEPFTAPAFDDRDGSIALRRAEVREVEVRQPVGSRPVRASADAWSTKSEAIKSDQALAVRRDAILLAFRNKALCVRIYYIVRKLSVRDW